MSSKHTPRVSYAAAVSSSSKMRPHPASPASTAPSGSTLSTEQGATPAFKSESPLALASWPLVSSTAPASAPCAVSSLAREHTPPSQTPPSSTNLSEADMKLARVLHGLTALRLAHLGPKESETSYCQAALGPHFPSLPKQKQYTKVLHALVTLCTAESGHNLAAMAAFSSTKIKIFICQNDGRPFDEVKRHLEAVWVILQQVRHPVVLPNNSRNLNGVISPEPASASELTDKLLDLAHIFVAPKAISRAKKRFRAIEALYDRISGLTTGSKRLLISALRLVAKSANEVVLGPEFTHQKAWKDFRVNTRVLYNCSRTAGYDEDVKTLERLADFNLEKSIDKALKVHAAVLRLTHLATSPTRGRILGLDLEVQQVRLPPMMSIRLRLDSFGPYNRQGDQSSFYEDSPSSNYHDDGENIKSTGEVHPECQLVATLVDSPSLLDSVLLPYVSSPKLHCFCCHLWLDTFNKKSTTKVAFDGSHGDVQPDWLPPTLQAPLHEDILTQMCGHVEFEVWRRRTGTFSEAPRSTDADKKAREARRAFVALKLSKARETNEKPLSREEERKRWEATQVISLTIASSSIPSASESSLNPSSSLESSKPSMSSKLLMSKPDTSSKPSESSTKPSKSSLSRPSSTTNSSKKKLL